GATRLALLSVSIGFFGYLAFALFLPDEKVAGQNSDVAYELYVEHTQTVFGEVPNRITDLGVAPIGWAYYQYGLLGAGLGTGTQGTQYFGATAQGAAESGLGKIYLELGAPGLVVFAALAWALMRHLWAILKVVSRQSIPLSRMAFGLASFLAAN